MKTNRKIPHRMLHRVASQRRAVFARRQQGVAAVEFALVFPVMFLLIYGMITYGLIMVAQQTLTVAVGEGARAALRYSTSPASAACQAVDASATWLGANISGCASAVPVATTCPYPAVSQCLTVTATYAYAQNPLVPTLPGLNIILPTTLKASAIVQLSPNLPTS